MEMMNSFTKVVCGLEKRSDSDSHQSFPAPEHHTGKAVLDFFPLPLTPSLSITLRCTLRPPPLPSRLSLFYSCFILHPSLSALQPTLLGAVLVHAMRKPISRREEGRVVSVLS